MNALGCFGLLVCAVGAAILRGWALSVLWGWFAVPALGAPPLSIPAATGIALVAGVLTDDRHPADEAADKKKDSGTKVIEAIGFAVLYPAIVVGIGYIVHLFM